MGSKGGNTCPYINHTTLELSSRIDSSPVSKRLLLNQQTNIILFSYIFFEKKDNLDYIFYMGSAFLTTYQKSNK